MGQAKQRGSQADRIEQAKAKIEALKPDHLVCNNYQAEVTDIQTMNTRGIAGIDAAFAGICPSCGQSTYAIKGEPDAVANLAGAMEEAMEGEIKMGSQAV